MPKRKRKRTAAERVARKKRREDFQMVFVNGKMKRVWRPPTINGMSIDEFIRQNADPIYLHAEGMWWELEEQDAGDATVEVSDIGDGSNSEELPF